MFLFSYINIWPYLWFKFNYLQNLYLHTIQSVFFCKFLNTYFFLFSIVFTLIFNICISAKSCIDSGRCDQNLEIYLYSRHVKMYAEISCISKSLTSLRLQKHFEKHPFFGWLCSSFAVAWTVYLLLQYLIWIEDYSAYLTAYDI